MLRISGVLMLALLLAMPASAQTPQDVVRWIYMSLGVGPAAQQSLWHISAPAQRGAYFTRRMVAFYDANDTYGDDLAAACVDFGFAVPGNDFDAAEIKRTLRISAQEAPQRITVTADFTTFGQPARVTYEFAPEDGFWKIDDIAGAGFRVSQIPCTPKPAAAPPVISNNAYCYKTQDGDLRVRLGPDGRADLSVSIWISGHSCGADLAGQPVSNGWDFPGEMGCNLQLRVGADGAITLKDPDWTCKRYYCGMRASLDGISFPSSSQVVCQ